MELLGALAQRSVVLLDKVPADFVLGEVAAGGRVRSIAHRRRSLELLLVIKITVRRHCRSKWQRVYGDNADSQRI